LRIEGTLSLVSVCVLALVFCFVYLAKREDAPPNAVLLNEATAEQIASTLGVHADTGRAVIEYRTAHGDFSNVEQILSIPLLTRDQSTAAADTLQRAGIDITTAQSAQIATALRLPPYAADRIVQQRTEAGPPAKARDATSITRWLRGISLLDGTAVRPRLARIIVRTPGQVGMQFFLTALLVCALALLIPPMVRRRLGGDPFLLGLSLLLAGLGVAMLFSIKDPLRDQAVYAHHAIGIAISALVFVICARLAPSARTRLKNYKYVWVLAAIALVALLLLFGRGPEDVRLNLIFFQPVEIIKLLLVLFVASYLADRADLIADVTPPRRPPSRLAAMFAAPRSQDISPLLVMFVVALALFYVIKDLGPGVLLFATFAVTLYLTTGRSSFLWVGVGLILLGGTLGYALHIGVYPTRVDMWRSPFHNSRPTGMQLGESYWAMASGGIEGSGLGLGMPGLIPRGGSDLAFSSWAEETGLIGVWLVLLIYVVMVWRGLKIGLRASSDFDRTLALGLTTLLALQTLFIIAGVTGVVPLSGIALPFLSFGNSAMAANFALVGILRGISAPPRGGVGRPEARPEIQTATRRFCLGFAAALLIGIGIFRMGDLQVVHADEIACRPIQTPDADHVSRPHRNPRLLAIASQIERGSIYDRNGRVLATSRPSEIHAQVPNPQQAQRLLDTHKRLYPFGPATAQLVGYVSPAVGGPAGMERQYDEQLRGYHRFNDLLADYRNRNLPGYRPRYGMDLRLTIDAKLQQAVQGTIWQTVSRLRDLKTNQPKDRAAFVIVDPKSGDVLVAVNTPSYDPNTLTPDTYHEYVSGNDGNTEHRLINRAINGLYPPGSTLKIATTACALDTLPNAESIEIPCNQVSDDIRWQAGGKTYVRRDIHDDKGDPSFGVLALPEAFRVSSNIYFANLAARLPADTFRSTLFDKMSLHHTPGEAAFDADLPDIGYGQGRMLVSPLEMARLAGSVANSGVMMRSRILDSITDPTDKTKRKALPKAPLSAAMTASTAGTVRRLMRTVVEAGTATGVFDDLPVQVAGKTGTAQNHQFDREPHSWFVGFAPYESSGSPTVAFSCVVENGGYGKRVAAVICRNVLKELFSSPYLQ
jgi:cell division protein FtsI/penicillin-binding protein 2/cell division protein FtsW (lipid II flippase)